MLTNQPRCGLEASRPTEERGVAGSAPWDASSLERRALHTLLKGNGHSLNEASFSLVPVLWGWEIRHRIDRMVARYVAHKRRVKTFFIHKSRAPPAKLFRDLGFCTPYFTQFSESLVQLIGNHGPRHHTLVPNERCT